ncbi:MAG: phosphoglucomutase (alpha-D-glucose-1,6-bisphosphate-dependent) [Calditrichia bacterium]
MDIHPLAGKPVPVEYRVNIPRLINAYYTDYPDVENPDHRVSFGTSGHRGSSIMGNFNEPHILAITQAICDYRRTAGIAGPMFLGMDTHALSEAALFTAIEVLAGNNVEIYIQKGLGYTPTPVISHAILAHRRKHKSTPADGLILTPSHNPPEDGGIKYNPPSGGPADEQTTRLIEERANQILKNKLKEVKRTQFSAALRASTTIEYDYITPYVADLKNIINMEAIAASGIRIGVDPLGGSGVRYWDPIVQEYRLNLEVVNRCVDTSFAFMPLDKDGKIRMDCSSPYAMANLIHLKEKYDIAFGNDPDFDRHGIVTRRGGLMNPNHYLAVAIWYLFQNRPEWPSKTAVGKTLVSSAMIDRVAGKLNKKLIEVPVGFKWFVEGLLSGTMGFAGEESAGAAFLRKDGTVWTTDKDGFIMDLLAAEISAVSSCDPYEHYQNLTKQFGAPVYERIDAPATAEQRKALKNISPEMINADTLAGEKIIAKLKRAPGNGAPIGGLKVVTENGWFAARPSGTENIYKIYAESFKGAEHLKQIQQEAENIISRAFKQSLS